MGIRDTLNQKSGLFIGVSIAVTLLAVLFATVHARSRGKSPAPKFATQYFYTTDDGTTLFAGGISNIPPFDHDGREAVRAYVFSCDGGKHRWVQYLEKYSPEGRKIAETFENGTAKTGENLLDGLLVKRPGAPEWVKKLGDAASNVVIPTCPDGMGDGKIVEVYP